MEPLQLEARKKIYECIVASPGLHFREIQRRLGMATGSLDYHLHRLHRSSLIRTEKDRKYLRYYPLTKNWDEEEKAILSLLRQKNLRHILVYLLEKKRGTPRNMALQLGISTSTLSWYLKNLSQQGVIDYAKKGRQRFYRVSDPEKIVKYLIVHKASFFDELVDRFIETWSE